MNGPKGALISVGGPVLCAAFEMVTETSSAHCDWVVFALDLRLGSTSVRIRAFRGNRGRHWVRHFFGVPLRP